MLSIYFCQKRGFHNFNFLKNIVKYFLFYMIRVQMEVMLKSIIFIKKFYKNKTLEK